MEVLRDSGARCEKIPKNYVMILTLLFFMVASTANSFPIELPTSTTEADPSEKIKTKRSPPPLEIGSFDVSTQQNTHYEPTAHTSVEIAYPSSSSPIRTNSANRGPSISNSVINLIERQIKEHPVEEVIVSLSDFHQTITHTRANSELNGDYKENQDVNHSTHVGHIIDEESLLVLPLHATVPTYQPYLITSHPNLAIPDFDQESNESKVAHSENPPRNRRRMHKRRNIYRDPIGGFGVGWKQGGHGAGHGYYLHT